MSGFFKPPAADRAPWIGPEQSQQNTQSEKKPQSVGERIRHKGRRCLEKAPSFLNLQNRKSFLARLIPNSHNVKADVNYQSLPAVYNPPADLKAMDAKKELQGPFTFPAQQQQQPYPALIPRPAAAVNNIPLYDTEGHIIKLPSSRDWLKEHTISSKRVNSAPVLSLGLVDLTGVGSQYDATNRPTSALPTGTDQSTGYPQGQQQSSETTLNQTTIPAWNRQVPEPREQVPFPEPSPSEINLSRRLSNDTSQGYNTTAESIFTTRPSSTISAASTWDSSIGRAGSPPSQRKSLFKRTLSSTSSLHISRDFSNSIGGHAVPPIPNLDLEMRKRLSLPYPMPAHQQVTATATPPGLIAVRATYQDCTLTVSDQVALTGWVAQQRRANKSPLANQMQDESALDLSRTPLPLVDIELHPVGDPDPELATIEERLSETGLSNDGTVSAGRGCSGDHVTTGSLSNPHYLSPRHKSHSAGASTTTDMRSATASNRDFMDQANTPASSVSDIGEEVEDDTSEADESISNVSRETDESWEEAFHASSLDPALLDTVTALKDQITKLVMERVSDWVTTCSPGQDSGQGTTGPADDSGFHQSDTGQDNNAKKRRLNDDDEDEHANHAGRGNGDDQDKRRKTETAATRAVPNLACPFVKEYAGEKWPKCQKGWPSVHRIKEHIYRSHKSPIHCKRCFTILKTEKQLELHLRQEQACEVLHPPREMPGIDAETKERLKSRQGIQNNSEEERWARMYKILFPLTHQVPSPYCDLQTLEAPMTAEERAQYRSFLRREIPFRVIRDININIMTEPHFNTELSERRLFEMISSAVWNAFDAVLPSLLPQIEPPDIPPEHIAVSEIAAEHRHQSSPQVSPSTRPQTDLPDHTRELSNAPETIMRSQEPEPPNTDINDSITYLDTLNHANPAAIDLGPLPDEYGNIYDCLNYDSPFDFPTLQD